MNTMRTTGLRSRSMALGAMIALSLMGLAIAVSQRTLTATDASTSLEAPDFVVTSPRDTGPGTLREAILAADRLSTRARILITAPRITLESALPALVNPQGIEIEAASGAGTIDAARQETGAVLQIDSPKSALKGLHVVNARTLGVVVNVADVRLDAVSVSGSKVGVLLSAAALDCTILTSVFERNETGVMAEAGLRRASVLSSVFRGNTRAGFWRVAAEPTGAGAKVSAKNPVRDWMRIADSVFDANTQDIVLANQPTWVQKSRFIGHRESAVLILGGTARLEDSEIRTTAGAAVSVTSGTDVLLARNTFSDNASMAISLRDSEVTIEGNTLERNALGIVSVSGHASFTAVVRDNVIRGTAGDAITLIGGAPVLQRNRIIDNTGVGLRSLDLVQGSRRNKALPRLDANLFRGNGTDTPVTGDYALAGEL